MYTMRPLKTSDIFKMSKILKKMNIELKFAEGISQTEMGVQFVQKILENLHLAEDEINAFLADLVGITAEEFAVLDIEEILKIFELFKEQKGLASFLELAGK